MGEGCEGQSRAAPSTLPLRCPQEDQKLSRVREPGCGAASLPRAPSPSRPQKAPQVEKLGAHVGPEHGPAAAHQGSTETPHKRVPRTRPAGGRQPGGSSTRDAYKTVPLLPSA